MGDGTASRSERADLPPEFFGQGRPPRIFASRAWYALSILFPVVLCLVAILVGLSMAQASAGVSLAFYVALFLVGTASGIATAKCRIHAKRLRAPSAIQILAEDDRAPIIYFRPFTADLDTGKPIGPGWWFTEEEELARAVNDIGPLVAIGEPQEDLSRLGAARMYVADPKWHEAALALVRRARLVIMRIGSSPGFWWELEAVMKSMMPEQLILLIPRNQALYDEFQRKSRGLIPFVLPALTGWEVKKWLRGSLRGVIFFNKEWVPSVVNVQTYRVPFMRRSWATPLVPMLKFALRPVYGNLGLPWRVPRIAGSTILIMVAAVMLILPQILRFLLEAPWESWFSKPQTSYSSSESTSAFPEPAQPSPPPPSKVTVAVDRFVDRMRDDPDLRARVKAMVSEAGSSPEERQRLRDSARQMAAELSKAGFKRLNDESLLALAAINGKLMMQSNIPGCAAITRGNIQPGVFYSMLEELDTADVDQWFELTYQAMVAELRQSPPARLPATDVELQNLVKTMLDDLPEADQQRLREALASPASDDEVCWAGRMLQTQFDKLGPTAKIQWMLAKFN